jgi:hypothetical protein
MARHRVYERILNLWRGWQIKAADEVAAEKHISRNRAFRLLFSLGYRTYKNSKNRVKLPIDNPPDDGTMDAGKDDREHERGK